MTVLTIVSTVASLLGAIIAIVQARKSKTYAQQAKAIKSQFIDRRKAIEVSKVYSETQRILRRVSNIGPTSTATSVKTVITGDIAKEVEEYARFLNEQSTHFSTDLGNHARILRDAIKDDIVTLAESSTFEDKKSSGVAIYYKIEEFLPLVKTLLDDKKEFKRFLVKETDNEDDR